MIIMQRPFHPLCLTFHPLHPPNILDITTTQPMELQLAEKPMTLREKVILGIDR